MSRVTLPNGLEITEINRHETEFLYNEIFVDEIYISGGLQIEDDCVVFDVGANIGLFAMYIQKKFRPRQIFCVEPAPHCVGALKENTRDFQTQVTIVAAALGASEGEAEFTYYPNYTIMSSLLADDGVDGEVFRAGARTQLQARFGDAAGFEEFIERMAGEIATEKLKDAVRFACPIRTLSGLIDEFGVERIGLLKVDVERAENLVLAGLSTEHWDRIDQLFVDVHDQGGQEHEAMKEMLIRRGFRAEIIAEKALANSGIYELIARR